MARETRETNDPRRSYEARVVGRCPVGSERQGGGEADEGERRPVNIDSSLA